MSKPSKLLVVLLCLSTAIHNRNGLMDVCSAHVWFGECGDIVMMGVDNANATLCY